MLIRTRNGWANFLFFQWLGIRRVKVTDLETDKVTIAWIKAVPMTGWSTDYILWGGDKFNDPTNL
jgi:hypothetical protein